MHIYPAIDLRGGQCVRLRQGDYSQETVFGADPASMAKRWVDEGAKFLHVVDLDGAKDGHPVNQTSVQAITKAVDVPCQLGGGIRNEENIREVLGWGVRRVIIGTRALQNPDWLLQMCHEYPDQIVLGIDARNGMVATAGWLDVSEMSAFDLARRCADYPLAALVYTDISRDGMMQGPNFDATAEMAKTVSFPVIASGGVTTLDDVRRLVQIGVAGCIVGRALYEGQLNLPEVLEVAVPSD
ncbi:MAG: 1-(5-phosphoribosyl)-5-[(5-phosphoribosylamino)methylideneamino]imidazole-4-carboxamide isomerase [Gemmataceae bacterium]